MATQLPAYPDSLEWITAYLTAHSLSVPSWRYTFLLWLAVVLIFLVLAVLRCTSSSAGQLGAIWSKWSLRSRTWQKKHILSVPVQSADQPHRQPISLPSNAQFLSLSILVLGSFALAFVGPDYLAPTLKVWQIQARSPPSLRQSYDTSTFTQYMPQYTISKSLWSSSARAGQIAFALSPLCILFALKAPPFAIFAIPFTIELHFDKLAWLHRWAGRLIWFLALVHVILWSIQLARDVNPSTGRIAYLYAWSYTPFIYGWIAFVLLTLIVIFSLKPIRRRFYERFYILHVLLVPATLVIAGLHHPAVAWWCWTALLLWFGERLWRATWWIYANGIIGGIFPGLKYVARNYENLAQVAWDMDGAQCVGAMPAFLDPPTDARASSPLRDYYDKSRNSIDHDISIPKDRTQVPLLQSTEQNLLTTLPSHLPSPYIPPVGYVHAELLSGRTVRLRIITPGFLPWSPGQHFLLNIPSVSRFTSHPFTCASVCDEEAPTDAGCVMLFLVRTKGGWTQDLWNLVSRLSVARSRGNVSSTFASKDLPKNGVLLRAYVDGPFGSAKRTRWENYSTGIIIAGGSGVSFGLSLLQYMCMSMAGRDGKCLGGRSGGLRSKGSGLERVRFIWLVREYSHVHWCASIVRRCMSIVPLSALQVDIFVTNFKPIPSWRLPSLASAPIHSNYDPTEVGGQFEPPRPKFHRPAHSHSGSTHSIESPESDVDLSYYLGESFDREPPADEIQTAHEANILNLTNFGGEVDMALPEEAYLSRSVKKEGKLRRLQSRSLAIKDRLNQDARSSRPLARGDIPTPQRAQDSRRTHLDPSPSSSRSRASRSRKAKTRSTEGLLGFSEQPNISSTEMDGFSPFAPGSAPSFNPYAAMNSAVPSNVLSATAKSHCVAPTGSQESHSVPLSVSMPGELRSQFPFEMDEQEVADINIVSEHTRPGKPRLDKVITDEVQASKGPIVVACCGPTSLNVIVRKIVADQIDPRRIRKGDLRGSITLVSEEFEY